MSRLPVLLATGNRHKVGEIRAILKGRGLALIDLRELDPMPEPEETEPTYEGNALLKALHYHRLTCLPCLADDSGLEVDAMGGEPGVLSSRFGGPGASQDQKIQGILARLEGVPPAARTARFRCHAVLVGWAPAPIHAEGVCEGRIALAPSGEGGFGYDPIFEIPDLGRTMAELTPADKHRISHRGRALVRLAEQAAVDPAAPPGVV